MNEYKEKISIEIKNHINRLNKQDRNIRTWKNKEGNLCFSYDMRDPMENPTIIIIILLVFIGIILFEYLCLNSYHSLIILPFSFFFIFIGIFLTTHIPVVSILLQRLAGGVLYKGIF